LLHAAGQGRHHALHLLLDSNHLKQLLELLRTGSIGRQRFGSWNLGLAAMAGRRSVNQNREAKCSDEEKYCEFFFHGSCPLGWTVVYLSRAKKHDLCLPRLEQLLGYDEGLEEACESRIRLET